MACRIYKQLAWVAAFCLLVWGAGVIAPAAALSKVPTNNVTTKRIQLEDGHTRLIVLPRPVKRVSVGNPKVADVVVITPLQLYVNGRGVGSTSISIWDQKNYLMGAMVVEVVRDLTRLKEQLNRILPREPVQVRELNGSVVLSGRVSSNQAKAQIEAVAKAFAPKKVTSLLTVGERQQVLLKVRFAEVNRRATRNLNVGLGFFDSAGSFFNTFISSLYQPYDTAIGNSGSISLTQFNTELAFSNSMNAMGGFRAGGKFMVFLQALKENGLARILAEPNLVATSGKEARFLAGGEFPVPVPQKDTVTILFKKFGVELKFKPEVLANGEIRLEVAPEVSDIDYNTAVTLQNFVIPGITTRRAKTQLQLKDGQSFAIAGLFKDEITQTVSKIPLLGDIPILGILFRSTAFQRRETELVIVVTPYIVRPGMGRPGRLPTDGFHIPSDWEIFLLARMASRVTPDTTHKIKGKGKGARPKGSAAGETRHLMDGGMPRSFSELEGDFGHGWNF